MKKLLLGLMILGGISTGVSKVEARCCDNSCSALWFPLFWGAPVNPLSWPILANCCNDNCYSSCNSCNSCC